MFAHFMMGGDLRVHTMLSVQQFLIENGMTPVLYPPNSPILTRSNFCFVPQDEKSPQRETFCQCGRGKTKKWQKHQKASKSTGSKTFEQWKKKVSIGVLHQTESTLKVTEI